MPPAIDDMEQPINSSWPLPAQPEGFGTANDDAVPPAIPQPENAEFDHTGNTPNNSLEEVLLRYERLKAAWPYDISGTNPGSLQQPLEGVDVTHDDNDEPFTFLGLGG